MAEEAPTPKRYPAEIVHELDDLAGLADALCLLSEAGRGGDERCVRAMSAIAQQISVRVDALSEEVRTALTDPAAYMGQKL